MKRFLDRLAILVGSGFYTGYSPVASGTVGSLVGVPIFLAAGGLRWGWYLAVVAVVTAAGVWAASRCTIIYREKDSSRIVVDEVAGFLVSMTGVPVTWGWMLAGFIIFRIFDIVKPPPAGWADATLEGGLGVMLDDLVAGAYTCLVLQIFLRWFG